MEDLERRKRRMRRASSGRVLTILVAGLVVLVCGLMSPASGSALPPTSAIRYVYDADGQLKAMIEPAGETALYTWDPAGNLLSIARRPSSGLSIVQLSPIEGSVGESVTISGTGFSTTPSDDTVKFDGTTASVSSATSTQLVVAVPAGASSGTVSVQTPSEGPTTSTQSFTVGSSGPAISSLSTTLASVGSEITITGSNFEPNPYDDLVTVNRSKAEVIAASSTSITFKVPEATGGHVSVETPRGGSTGPDLYIPPNEIAPSKVSATERISIGGTLTIKMTEAEQVALTIFDATAGQRVSMTVAESTIKSGHVSIWSPEGAELTVKTFSEGSSGYATAAVVLPVAGTYTVLLEPGKGYTGNAKLTLPATVLAAITPSEAGASQTVATTQLGQKAEITFTGTEGERVFLESPESTYLSGCCNVEAQLLDPNGLTLASGYMAANSIIDTQTLPSTGTYTVYVDPVAAATGSIKITSYSVPANFSSAITPSEAGAGQTVKTTVPGQNGELTFSGTAGQRIFINSSEWSYGSGCCKVKVSLKSPDGTTLATQYLSSTEPAIDTQTLPSTGTYTVYVDPVGAATGSIKLTTYLVPADSGGAITIGGASLSVATSVPGQNAGVTFSGPASKGIKLTLNEVKVGSSTCCSMHVSIQKPEGAGSLVAPKLMGTSGGIIEATLTVAGTYTILIDPVGASTGSLKLTLADPPATSLKPGVTLAAERLAGLAVDPFAPRLMGATHLTVDSRISRVRPDRRLRRPRRRTLSEATQPLVRDARHAAKAGRATHGGTPLPAEALAFTPSGPEAWSPPTAHDPHAAWVTGEPASPWATIAPLHDPTGSTALAGRVLAQNGSPVAGIQLALAGTYAAATTDATGRFLLSRAVRPGQHILVIGGENSTDHKRYGTYSVAVTLQPNRTTVLPYTIWLTPLNPLGDRRVKSPTQHETRLTTPQIPGLEVRLPSGTVVTDRAGHTVRNLNITAIPVDRPPFPLPPFVRVPLYFTVQPGRAYLSKGAQIVYPNWSHLPPGQRVDFWDYDASQRGWYVYGKGTVTADGQQIAPDRGVRIWEFSGAMISSSPTPPRRNPKCEALRGLGTGGPVLEALCKLFGDPTDAATGLFVYHNTDLVLPDSIPIVIERTYRQSDTNSYSFGIGMTNLYDTRIYRSETGTKGYKEAFLVLPDGQQIRYVRTSPGEELTGAEYKASGAPGPFAASVLKYQGSFQLILRDGLTYIYPLESPLSAIRDRFGNQLTIKRDAGGYGPVLRVTSPHGLWVAFTNDAYGRVTDITDSGGRHLKYSYTSAGLLEKVIDATGRSTTYGYNASKELTSVTDGRGIKYIEIEYDAHERVAKQKLADGGTYTYEYAEEGGHVTATTVTDPRNLKTQITFNSAGYPTGVTRAVATEKEAQTTFERQPETNLLLAETDPLGRKTTFEYDESGNVKKKTVLAGTSSAKSTEYSYLPGTEELKSTTDALKHTVAYTYGANGELLSKTDALGHETTYRHDSQGELTSVTNPLGQTMTRSYTAGEVTGITDASGRTTRRFVDSIGRLAALTDPSGQRTLYEYGADDELTKVTAASGNVTSYEYNGVGELVSTCDPNKHTSTKSYTTLDELESETDALGHATTAVYDKDRNLIELTDRRGKVSRFSYDALNRLAEARYGTSGETAERTISYSYDAGNRLTKIVDSATGTYTPEWDGASNLRSLASPTGTVSYAYNDDNLRTSMTTPGAEAVEYSYDQANRLTELKRGSQTVFLAYDSADRPLSTTLPDGIEEKYGYDESGEPTSLAYQKGSERLGEVDYAYNASGRREAVWGSYAHTGLPEAVAAATYNADNEQTERSGKRLSYDADGNLTNDGITEYKWDTQGQLAEMTGGTTATFSYDPFGRRIERKLEGGLTKTLYDGPNSVQETKGGATVNLLSGLAVDKTYARTTTAGTESLLTDANGSTIGLGGESGKVETSYTYDPFGGTTREGVASDNPFQYAGRENDGDGLYYNRARYYSPAGTRFVSEDPLGEAGGGSNRYRYADNDPIDALDPYGTKPLWPVHWPKCYPFEIEGGEQCSSAPPGEPGNPFGPYPPPSGPPPTPWWPELAG